jgi:hypothetical protein
MIVFFIYALIQLNEALWVKIGFTSHLAQRLWQYKTHCIPLPEYRQTYEGIWEITATNETEARHIESLVHAHFAPFRGEMPTEWFKMTDHLARIDAFVTAQPWFRQRRSLDPRTWPKEDPSQALTILPNPAFISSREERQTRFDAVQAPLIDIVQKFLSTLDPRPAAYLVAACGSGKTHMTTEAIARSSHIERLVVVCPSLLVVEQWRARLERVFSGCLSTSTTSFIRSLPRWCLLVTNASSEKLISVFSRPSPLMPHLVVFDEVHHMAGRIVDGTGYGQTRRFMNYLIRSCPSVKRFGLTYTPRNVQTATSSDSVFSMSEEADFGPCLATLPFRSLETLETTTPGRVDIAIKPDEVAFEVSAIHSYRRKGWKCGVNA